MWADVSFVSSQFTRLTDGRTDGHLTHVYTAAAHLHLSKMLSTTLSASNTAQYPLATTSAS